MNPPSADSLVIVGLFVLLAFLVLSDVRRPGFSPDWQLYVALIAALLVMMGYSIDTEWVTISKGDGGGE